METIERDASVSVGCARGHFAQRGDFPLCENSVKLKDFPLKFSQGFHRVFTYVKIHEAFLWNFVGLILSNISDLICLLICRRPDMIR